MKKNTSAPMNIIDSRAVARVAPGPNERRRLLLGSGLIGGIENPPRRRGVGMLLPQKC